MFSGGHDVPRRQQLREAAWGWHDQLHLHHGGRLPPRELLLDGAHLQQVLFHEHRLSCGFDVQLLLYAGVRRHEISRLLQVTGSCGFA